VVCDQARPGKFGIFDTFANEADRDAHLSGTHCEGLGALASELLRLLRKWKKVEVLATTPLKGLVRAGR